MALIPAQGDVVWIDFDPQVGHEQSGRRPALILSLKSYNQRAGLAVLCPITRQIKGYIFEVLVPPGHPVTGAILTDQVKSMDWADRDAEYLCTLPIEVVGQFVKNIVALVGV